MDEKRTLELRLPRPPLQLLKLPSVGSGQGTLGTQASSTIIEPPRTPPRLELLEVRTPPVVWMLLLPPKKVTPRERVELESKGSGPHTTPPRELLTAAEKRPSESQRCFSFSYVGGPNYTYTKIKPRLQWRSSANLPDVCICPYLTVIYLWSKWVGLRDAGGELTVQAAGAVATIKPSIFNFPLCCAFCFPGPAPRKACQYEPLVSFLLSHWGLRCVDLCTQ